MSDQETAGPVSSTAGTDPPDTSWAAFEAAAPDAARAVAEQLTDLPAYLATVDAQGAPRVHPVSPVVGSGRLFVFMEPTSPKGRDLMAGRPYGLHNGVPDNDGTGGECLLRGHAQLVNEPESRDAATRAATYPPADRFVLFELSVDSVVSTRYVGDEPRRARWSATSG